MLGLLLAAMPSALRAETVAQEFAEANRAYSAGKYETAIAGYERLNRAYGYDAAVLFNLGNAYFQTNDLGRAILNYERALLLTPSDPDVQANLDVARERAGVEVAAPRWWQSVLESMTPNQWAWAAFVLLLLFTGLLLLYWFRPGPIGVRWWRLVLFVVFLAAGLTVACAGMAAMERHYAVVVVKEARVLQAPFEKAKRVAALPEGERVAVDKIDRQYEKFVRVRYGKRQLGWVSREEVRAVEPGLWAASAPTPEPETRETE